MSRRKALAPYQVMPPLSPEDLTALSADIAAHGVQVPVLVDEQGAIIDGHHRAAICDDLGIPYDRVVLTGLSEDAKLERALMLNVGRRQLTAEKRQEVAKTLRAKGWTYERIAQALGVDPATAFRDVRREIANAISAEGAEPATGPPEPPATITTQNGTVRPAAYAPRAAVAILDDLPPAEPDPDEAERRAAAVAILDDLPPVAEPRGTKIFLALTRHYHYVEDDPAAVAAEIVRISSPFGAESNSQCLRAYGEWVLAVVTALETLRQQPLRAVE